MTAPQTHSWLPDQLSLNDFNGMADLEIAAYAVFQQDWSRSSVFRGDEVRVHRHPHKANPDRWHTYWHAVTEGHPEETRTTPMQDRLERSPWILPLVENEEEVKVWSNIRGRDRHICIWMDRKNYLVILKKCKNHYLLKTAYCPESRRRQQLHREYANWKKTGCAL